MSKETKAQQAERQEAIEWLRARIKPGDTIHCNLKHVSKSGMYRVIDLRRFYVGEKGQVESDWLSRIAARALRERYVERPEGIGVSGAGMDMGFHLVYNLGYVLFPGGFGEQCTAEGCTYRPSSKEEAEHCNDGLREGVTPHTFRGRNGDRSGWDPDGGYALQYRWL